MENDNVKLKVKKRVSYNLYIVFGSYLAMIIPGIINSPQMQSYDGGAFRTAHFIRIIIFSIIAIIFGTRSIKRKESEVFGARGLVYAGVIVVLFSLLLMLDLE